MTATKIDARPRRRFGIVDGILGLSLIVAFLLVLQFVPGASSLTVPKPSLWFVGAYELVGEPTFWEALLQTVVTFIIALVVSSIVGLALGILFGVSSTARMATAPVVEFVRAIPIVALLPAALLLLGYGVATQVTVVTLGAMFPIMLSTIASCDAVLRENSLMEAGRTWHLSRGQAFAKVLLPAVMPGFLGGIRVAAPLALIVTIAVEFLSGSEGLGGLLNQAQASFDSQQVFGLLIMSTILGFATNSIVRVATSRVAARRGLSLRST